MRAIIVRNYGPYQEEAKLETVPKPEAPGTGEVLIRNKTAGVSFATSLNIAGKYQRKPPLPFVPGTEVGGIVEAVGPNVSRVAVGDHVMCSVDSGGMSGFNVTSEFSCHKIPIEMSFAAGSMLITSYTTSYGALVRRANLKAGEILLVHGAAGAVGLAAVEIGKAVGAIVIAVAGGEKHCQAAQRHGADHIIDHRQSNFRDVVMEITNGRGVDVVYDSIGGEVTHQSIRAMAWEGRLLTIGYACGEIPQIPANMLLLKNISAMGFNLGHFFGWSPGGSREQHIDVLDEMVAGVLKLHADGKINPEIGAEFSLSDFRQAMDAVIDRKVDGKCVIMIESEDY
ncbi:NADPH:quinone oxidoreductase family protein [Sneathiella marina]|uniref:NADPH:quinone oxidoreductase family protein n=1 Tax=Sneathiella marina TaxID=2950108 RepID=A0ABY4W6L2_9PROT|nr:NADPH:quinone oxidoreductase family protein [Sneathiella marina]USG60934.1 NADPH:quinone oxidoreductase family protein [Sneathiella marina]